MAEATMREYETIFMLRPDMSDEAVDALREKVRGIIHKEGGKVIKFTNWGKKKTAFPVAKQLRAIYVHTDYLGKPGVVAEVERNLRNMEEVTKFVSVKLADNVDPESRPVEQDVKLAGDVDEVKPTREEHGGYGSFGGAPGPEMEGPAFTEEASEEA